MPRWEEPNPAAGGSVFIFAERSLTLPSGAYPTQRGSSSLHPGPYLLVIGHNAKKTCEGLKEGDVQHNVQRLTEYTDAVIDARGWGLLKSRMQQPSSPCIHHHLRPTGLHNARERVGALLIDLEGL